MALLKLQNTKPPGGYTYLQAETGLVIDSDSLHGLVAKVIQHRQYRSLGPTDDATVLLEVQRQICSRLGENECYAEKDDTWTPVPRPGHIRLTEIMAFSKTMLEWIKAGGALVPMEEAQRRRGICAKCPLNQMPTGCKCGLLYKMIAAIIPKERRFEDLHVCKICACTLKAKASLPLAVIEAGTAGRNLAFPVHCWQHKSLPPVGNPPISSEA